MFILSLLSQIVEPINYKRKWLIQRLLISAIPPLLGLILSVRFYKEEKIEQRDQVFLIMSIVIAVIMGSLTIAYGLLILLLYIGSVIPSLSWYFLSVGVWGLAGITLADSGLFYRSEIKINSEVDSSKMDSFTNQSSIYISKVLSTSKNRFIFLFISYLTTGFAMLIVAIAGNAPVSI